MRIQDLMDDIRKLNLVMPEFQREYVWTRDQAKQLLVSLVRGYPTGSVLFWKTDAPPEIKNNAVDRQRLGTTSVILDGQQRLTTLYLFTQDAIPPYYTSDDILNDPRTLHYNLEAGDFQYYQPAVMRGNPIWVRVTDCFSGAKIDVFKIAQERQSDIEDAFVLAQLYNGHLTKLRNTLLHDYPVQTVPSDASITDAIDVFDRVNSQGTRLSEAELALAHVTGKWPQARRLMKGRIDEMTPLGFRVDLTFMVRALTAVVQRRAEFATIHGAERFELENGWKQLTRLLDYLTTILPRWASINSTDDLNTTNVLIVPLVHLARAGAKFSTEDDLKRFIHWMYAALAWSRYTSQTTQRLDHDVSLVVRSTQPWTDLVAAIIDQRGRIEVKAADLEGRGTLHPLFRMSYVLAKANGAVDWFNGLPLERTKGTYAIHTHHVFPQALMYRSGYEAENHLHKQIVNEIANRAFLTGPSNIGLSDRPPAEYLPEVEKQYPGALQKQFIPLDRSLWELDRFEDFLEVRRQRIAAAFNGRMDSLLREPEPERPVSVDDLIEAGESPTLEFKSTLRWDVVNRQVNRDLSRQTTKTIAAMLNSEGGVLLIGVADDGSTYGIEDDISSLSRPDRDGFLQALNGVVAEHLGPEFAGFIHPSFEAREGRTVCRIGIDASPRPVFLRAGGAPEFYIRVGNTTRALDPEAMYEYTGMHWET